MEPEGVAATGGVGLQALTQSVKHHAVNLWKQFGLKLPDAIVAATALDATLIARVEEHHYEGASREASSLKRFLPWSRIVDHESLA